MILLTFLLTLLININRWVVEVIKVIQVEVTYF